MRSCDQRTCVLEGVVRDRWLGIHDLVERHTVTIGVPHLEPSAAVGDELLHVLGQDIELAGEPV